MMAGTTEITLYTNPTTGIDNSLKERTPVPNENQVLKWVQEVDKLIDKSSMEIMKLGLRTELTQAEMEDARTPSDLYHLIKRIYPNSEDLSRFMYALKKLGHRRYGENAVRKLDKFGITRPNQFNPVIVIDSTKLRLFNFYQCLVEICSHLDQSYHKQLITRSTKMYLGGRNHRLIKTPCKLFVTLLEETKITEDDQSNLVEVLKEIGAKEYIKYIDQYRRMNIPEDTTTTSTKNFNPEPIIFENCDTASNYSSITDTSTEGPKSNDHHQFHDVQYFGVSQPISDPNSNPNPWKLPIHVYLISSILIVLGILAIITFGTVISSYRMSNSNIALYHDSTTVILTELNHFFTGSITVTQDTGYPGDSDHKIDVYIVNSKCNDLPTLERTNNHTGKDLSAINKTTLYLLAGSSITYSVCESTSQTIKTGRLEVVILDNLKSAESPENIRNSFHKFAYFSMHKNNEPSCDVITHSFEANGYYTIVFILPPYQAQFEYNVTYHIKSIDIGQLSVVANHTLYTDKEGHEFPLDFGTRRSCSLATIKNGLTPYLHIQLETKQHYDLWVTIFLGVVCGIIVIASIAAILALICCHLHVHRYNLNNNH